VIKANSHNITILLGARVVDETADVLFGSLKYLGRLVQRILD
jgi:hypothetical protein